MVASLHHVEQQKSSFLHWWSLFVGSKRLKAGDSLLFIRGEKSLLLVCVRWANHQQTTFPSSVLSADGMHIGVSSLQQLMLWPIEANSLFSTTLDTKKLYIGLKSQWV